MDKDDKKQEVFTVWNYFILVFSGLVTFLDLFGAIHELNWTVLVISLIFGYIFYIYYKKLLAVDEKARKLSGLWITIIGLIILMLCFIPNFYRDDLLAIGIIVIIFGSIKWNYDKEKETEKKELFNGWHWFILIACGLLGLNYISGGIVQLNARELSLGIIFIACFILMYGKLERSKKKEVKRKEIKQ